MVRDSSINKLKHILNVKKTLESSQLPIEKSHNIYSLMGRFSKMTCFFGSGPEVYHWAKDRILQLDPLNPQVARMAGCFNLWKKTPEKEQLIIQVFLKEMLEKDLSPNTEKFYSDVLFELTSIWKLCSQNLCPIDRDIDGTFFLWLFANELQSDLYLLFQIQY